MYFNGVISSSLSFESQKGVASQHLTYSIIDLTLLLWNHSYKSLVFSIKLEIICQMLRRNPSMGYLCRGRVGSYKNLTGLDLL